MDNFEKSCICGSDVDIELKIIEKSEANAYLHTIVSAWYQNRKDVLPIAIKSIFAYLESSAPPDLKAAKEEYEDKYENADMRIKPEVKSDLYLKRIFPTFKDLVPNDKGSVLYGEFEKWANELYLPIKQNAKAA